LHGQVATDVAKAQAETRTREVRGVREVRNLLTVVPEAARERTEQSDDAVQKQVEQALERDPALAGSDIDVKSVNDGVVLLSGNAKTLSAHRRALETANSVDGVRNVASEIQSPDELGDAEIWQESAEVDSQTEATMSDGWITTKAKLGLMAEPGLSPFAVNVDTRGGVVTLFGIVGSADARKRAGDRVAGIDGVKKVENELQVVPDVAAGRVEEQDDKLQAAVSEWLAERESLSDSAIDVEVKNRVVRLTGSVADQADRLTALTVARTTSGIDSVIDDLALSRGDG
jgi:osmotically-inducible protein OsmY